MRRKAAAMRIRTQSLPNSFSLDKKKQKAVCPKLRLGQAFWRKRPLGVNGPIGSGGQTAKRFTRLSGISNQWRIIAVYT
jgi:hypothetical protein